MNLKNQKDFFSGLLFMAAGLSFAWTASRFAIGNAAHMGPGYFPLLLGALLAVLGGVMVYKALVFETEDGGRIGHWAWRPVVFIVLANLALGALIDRLASNSLPALAMDSAYTPDKLLAHWAEQFGAAENGAWIVLALMAAVVLARGSLLKALGMGVLGMLLGLVGTDAYSGTTRFALDIAELQDGIGLMVVAMAVLVYGEGIYWLARVLRLPYRWLFPAVVLLGALGVYATHHSVFAVWLVAALSLVGYGFHQLGMVPAPLLLGFVLGPLMETNLRSALAQSQGDWSVFVSRPLPVALLAAAMGLGFLALLPAFKVSRKRGHGN